MIAPHEELVTLLLPNYNNAPVLDLFFKKLIKNTTYEDYELVVVDDGSTDSSLKILERWQRSGMIERMRIIRNEHHGVVRTLNTGLRYAKGKYICRLDGDAVIETSNWLQKMLFFMKTDSEIGMVVAKIVLPHGTLHSAGRNVICPEGLHDRGTMVLEEIGKRTFDSLVSRVRDKGQFDDITEVDTALGCCTLFRKDLADRIGGFDENYEPVWIEDDDFGLSVRRYNGKVFYFPEVKVTHHTGMRLPRNVSNAPFLFRMRMLKHRLMYALPPHYLQLLRRTLARFKMYTPKRIMPKETTQWRINVLKHHYEYWRGKWGFDPLNPDTEEIALRWGDTEMCWADNGDMKERGREIVRQYYSRLRE